MISILVSVVDRPLHDNLESQDIKPMLVHLLTIICDAEPALIQRWPNVSFTLGCLIQIIY